MSITKTERKLDRAYIVDVVHQTDYGT